MNRREAEQRVLDLLGLIRAEDDEQVAKLMINDLVWSAGQLGPEIRARAIIHASAVLAAHRYGSETVASVRCQLDGWPVLGRPRVDFAIVTIKKPESDAAKLAFGVAPDQPRAGWSQGASFYHVEVPRPGRAPLTGVVTACGSGGNSQMAAFLSTVFSSYSIGLCCLVGMAAGQPRVVKEGDVVFADQILDAGRRIATIEGAEQDPVPYVPDVALARELKMFEPASHGWHAQIRQTLESANAPEQPQVQLPRRFDAAAYSPTFRVKTILASDDLIEDDSVETRAGRVGPARRTGAAEMEGAGFAVACREEDVPWLVIRGIADLGRPGRSKAWQFVSTLAAATALRLWFTSCGYFA